MDKPDIRFEQVTRPEQIREAASLADVIWHECYARILKPPQIDYMVHHLQSEAAMAGQIKNEGYEYFLVACGGANAGYIAVQAKGGLLLLSKLYVLADYRGRGIAKAAISFVEEAGRSRRCEGIWLTVNRRNKHAIAVYRKTGYRLAREQQVDIGGGFVMDDFVFEKPL
jgi:GNAT superfamily N-acetyltransferase